MQHFRKLFTSIKNRCNIFKKTENVDSIIDIKNQENLNMYNPNIFKKKSFTIKELCHYFLDIDINMNAPIQSINIENIRELCNCYLYFT